jgi:thiamine-phosphate pyrophosphorylase
LIAAVSQPIVYLITDGTASDGTFDLDLRRLLSLIELAVAENVTLIQIREKQLSARKLTELVFQAASITRGSATSLLVNDRADIALATGADGVHLATTSLPVSVARKHFPADFLIGVSTHSLEELQACQREGADFAVFGPIFGFSKKGTGKGNDVLASVCDRLRPFSVLALGGIDENNWRAVTVSGAAGFAAIRSLNDTASLCRITKAVRNGVG